MREARPRAERKTGKKDKPVDEDDLAKSPTTREPPGALGEDHSIPTQDATFEATSLRRYLNRKSLVGQGTVGPVQSSACRSTLWKIS
jgi:hypothetical protein